MAPTRKLPCPNTLTPSPIQFQIASVKSCEERYPIQSEQTNENAKTGILIALTMFWCYLSGMMGITMKYVVDKNVPIINKINPASMITDGFYSLYYYDTLDRYWTDIISLLIFAFVLISISFFSLRRQKYDSI